MEGFHEKVESYKRALVEDALREHNNNQVHAAKALGMDRSSLRRILEKILEGRAQKERGQQK